MSEPCRCEMAGWCERHQMYKSEAVRQVCLTDEVERSRIDRLANEKPVFCSRWERVGDALYRCARCGAVLGANHDSLLPKDRRCMLSAAPPLRVGEVRTCGGCGGITATPVESVPLPPQPTLTEKVKSLGRAAVDFVASGFDVTTGDELALRRDTCAKCDFSKPDQANCRVCGCVLAIKQRERAAHCPMGFWPANEYPWTPSANDEWLKQVMVVIPAYGKVEMTQQAVKDCFREAVHVAVIDNKGDYERIGREHVFRDGAKRGWGDSCRFAMQRLLLPNHNSKYLVLLNNDVRLSERFFSGLLIAAGATNAGIISACYSTGYGEQLHFGGYRGAAGGFKPRPFHREATQVDGTCVMFTRECLERVGVFDTSISPEFGWGLTTDMCIRARQAGIKTVVTEASYCEHLEGGCQTAKDFYGNLQTYRHGASREREAGLSRRWGDWRAMLTAPVVPTSPPKERRIETLNLIYHIWPVASNNRWKWNVEQLLKRIDIFNGKKVVAIAEGPHTSPVDEVKEAFKGHDVEFIVKPNSKELREANTFLELLDAVKTDDPTEATFYAHCKGVSRPMNGAEIPWAELMYTLLDDPERVKRSLAKKGMLGISFEFDTPWIFPGTFWWFHNASLFAKPNWRTLENPVTNEGVGWSVEAFPNRFFSDDCERIKPALTYPSKSINWIYDVRFWNRQSIGFPENWERDMLAQVVSEFDEATYLAANPDVAADVKAGKWPNGFEHFVRHGIPEGRWRERTNHQAR